MSWPWRPSSPSAARCISREGSPASPFPRSRRWTASQERGFASSGPSLPSRREVGQGDAVLFVEVRLTEDRLALGLDDRRPSHQKTVARSQPDVADLGPVHVPGEVLLEVELEG